MDGFFGISGTELLWQKRNTYAILKSHERSDRMPKVFNTTGICIPEKHYMVNIDKRLEEIKSLVDDENYFIINKARQYGKTTILVALSRLLQKDNYVVFIDFQTFGEAEFRTENIFSISFADTFLRLFKKNIPLMTDKLKTAMDNLAQSVEEKSNYFALKMLFEQLSELCDAADKKIILIIDEIDSATNNQVFIDFLAQLRAQYLKRFYQAAFMSVILAGVYDVEEGRQYFLLYLRPIINGVGNYYIESRTRDLRRTDVIVDYRGEQYIIEMKIWHGDEYNTRSEKQLLNYLDNYHINRGYMLSFNFNRNKTIGVREIIIGEKKIIEAVV